MFQRWRCTLTEKKLPRSSSNERNSDPTYRICIGSNFNKNRTASSSSSERGVDSGTEPRRRVSIIERYPIELVEGSTNWAAY